MEKSRRGRNVNDMSNVCPYHAWPFTKTFFHFLDQECKLTKMMCTMVGGPAHRDTHQERFLSRNSDSSSLCRYKILSLEKRVSLSHWVFTQVQG